MLNKVIDGFKSHPVQNTLIIVLIATCIGLQIQTLGVKRTTEVTKNSPVSAYLSLIGNPDKYFLPQNKKSTEGNTIQAGSNNKLNINLASSLYQYIGKGKENVSAGIRIKNKKISKSIIPIAYAESTTSYPAVYYWDQYGWDQDPVSAIGQKVKKGTVLFSPSNLLNLVAYVCFELSAIL